MCFFYWTLSIPGWRLIHTWGPSPARDLKQVHTQKQVQLREAMPSLGWLSYPSPSSLRTLCFPDWPLCIVNTLIIPSPAPPDCTPLTSRSSERQQLSCFFSPKPRHLLTGTRPPVSYCWRNSLPSQRKWNNSTALPRFWTMFHGFWSIFLCWVSFWPSRMHINL